MLFIHFSHVAGQGCLEHLFDEKADVVYGGNKIVRDCGLQHLHHLYFLALVLQQLEGGDVVQLQ
jgi:hypothetical protein